MSSSSSSKPLFFPSMVARLLSTRKIDIQYVLIIFSSREVIRAALQFNSLIGVSLTCDNRLHWINRWYMLQRDMHVFYKSNMFMDLGLNNWYRYFNQKYRFLILLLFISSVLDWQKTALRINLMTYFHALLLMSRLYVFHLLYESAFFFLSLSFVLYTAAWAGVPCKTGFNK